MLTRCQIFNQPEKKGATNLKTTFASYSSDDSEIRNNKKRSSHGQIFIDLSLYFIEVMFLRKIRGCTIAFVEHVKNVQNVIYSCI